MRKDFVAFLIFVLSFYSVPALFAAQGAAVIQGTESGSKISGKVSFEDTQAGLHVKADIANVSPGKHGFHIHQNGTCGDSGKAAGDHFNPDGVAHGLLLRDGLSHAHAGDLGNIEVAADGSGHLEAVLPNLTLTGGKYSVAGRSVILHQKEDDFGQPAGNAGARIGCGEITLLTSK